MSSLLRKVGDGMGILLAIVGIMLFVAVTTGLLMVSLELATWGLGFVSVWWAKLLGFSVVLMVVFGLAGGLGGYLWQSTA